MTPWLSIVGIGEDGLDGLSAAARALVEGAEVLVGGERHLAMVPEDGRRRIVWPKPLRAAFDEIAAHKPRRVCVLATGDPLCFGVGRMLLQRFPIEEVAILPSPSAFSLACARLGWSLPDVETLTVHGRPVAALQSFIQPGARLLILSAGSESPAAVAALLRERRYGRSEVTVLEHLGGAKESLRSSTAEDWPDDPVAELNSIAVDCRAEPGTPLLPRTPGLPDAAFRHDGQLTKREVRAATLAALAPVQGQRLWDVGAGCGSIAVEWLRAAPRAEAVALERRSDRMALIAENAQALGVPRLAVVAGEAPAALAELEPPDAVFIGGGATVPGVFEACWAALRPGGRLVANVVTLEGEAALLRWRQEIGGALTRIAVSRAEPVGGFLGWRPLMPVTQFAAAKS
ncbi:MAG: precorrin-6y C5,15-methyltransferase (decarboxylating) subunit CbiE [Kiloniellales bacterium]|nr:precorrin-6y C5,15-methyltransferase (decarboxylating) subunit CbiE [Kiloniellales bacterium]